MFAIQASDTAQAVFCKALKNFSSDVTIWQFSRIASAK